MDRQRTFEPALTRFARRLQVEGGAIRVLLFGSQARGDARSDSDYDLIIVSPRFADVDHWKRHFGLRDIWRQVGGNAAMDLICVTPDEFEIARHRINLIQAVLPEAIDLLPAEVPA